MGSQALADRMVACEVNEKVHADSDHLPIYTILDVETQAEEPTRRRNWKSMDEEKFLEFVSANLLGKRWMNLPREGDVLPRTIDDAVEYLMETVQRAVQESTPWARPSAWARQGWTTECTEAIETTRHLFRRWKRTETQEDRDEYKSARNRKGKVIKQATRQGFRQWVEGTIKDGPRGLWKVSKWARNRHEVSSGIIPALKKTDGGLAETNHQKAELLREVFFPQPPQADLRDIHQPVAAPQLQFPQSLNKNSAAPSADRRRTTRQGRHPAE